MLSFLKQIYQIIDYSVDNEVLSLYTDFLKAFKKVPHNEVFQKVNKNGVGGCILDVLFDYLTERRQYVRGENFKAGE